MGDRFIQRRLTIDIVVEDLPGNRDVDLLKVVMDAISGNREHDGVLDGFPAIDGTEEPMFSYRKQTTGLDSYEITESMEVTQRTVILSENGHGG